MNMKRTILLLVFFSMLLGTVYGQKERKFIRQGNNFFKTAVENSDSTGIDSLNFVRAEEKYRLAQEKRPDDFKASYNIGNAQFKQGMMPEATIQFEEAIELATSKEEKALAYYNYGDALLGQQKFDESIEAFKNALRNNPSDMEAKYNLEFARKMKEQQQQQQQQQNQDQNQNQNQNQNQDQNQEPNQNQDQNKNQDQKQEQKQDQQQQQAKISKQNAEQMLKALENDERQTQEKVKKAKAEKAKSSKPEIDW